MSAVGGGTIDRATVERLVREAVHRRLGVPARQDGYRPKLVVNISARHMHVSPGHLEVLFGPGAKLTPMRALYQEGQFAAEQTVTVIGPRQRMITNLRILGPERKESQIELAFTDGIALGIDLPVRPSGKIDGTPGAIVMGPKGHVVLEKGIIRAERHVHMHPKDAEYYGVRTGDYMALQVESDCPVTVRRILCRVDPSSRLEVHLDTDEGNACNLSNARHVELVKE